MHLNSFIQGACLISVASASYNIVSANDDVCAVIRKTVHVTVTETVTPWGAESSPEADGKQLSASGYPAASLSSTGSDGKPAYGHWVAADDGTSSGSAKPSHGYGRWESGSASISSAPWGNPGYGHEGGAWSADPIAASTSKKWEYDEAEDDGYGYGGASKDGSSYAAASLISSSADGGAHAHSGKPGSTSSKPTSETSSSHSALLSASSSSSGSSQKPHSDGTSLVSSSKLTTSTFASSSSSTASSSSSSKASSSSSSTASSSSTEAASSSSRASSSSAVSTISSFTSSATSHKSSASSTSSASGPSCVKNLHLGCSINADCCTNEADGTTCVEGICVPRPLCIDDTRGTCEIDLDCCNHLTGTTCEDGICTAPPDCFENEERGCTTSEECCSQATGAVCLDSVCTVPISCVDTDGSFEDAPDSSVGVFGATVPPWTVGGFALFARNGGITGFDTPFGTIFVNMNGRPGRTFSLTASFTLTPGLSYTLQYSYAHVALIGGNSCTVSATFAGLPVDSFDAGPGTFVGGTTWVPRAASFIPLVATSDLRFEMNCPGLAGTDAVQVLLDNISLAVEGATCA